MKGAIRPSNLADWLMAQGRHFITTEEVADLVGTAPVSVRQSLRRPRESNEIVSVTRGAWVPVPPEFRTAGAPPPAHFIDPLMRFLGHPYYVGFLTAAAVHGASHQAAMVFQVVTPAVLRNRQIGGAQVRFIRRSEVPRRAVIEHLVPTGRIKVSTLEVTLLDLVGSPRHGGGLSNVATVIGQLLEDDNVDPLELANQAQTYPTSVAQRAGYLIDAIGPLVDKSADLEELHHSTVKAEPVLLTTHRDRHGERDSRWGVIVNTEIEPDL